MNTCTIKILEIFFNKSAIFKFGFNFNPTYRRTAGRVTYVSKNLQMVKIKVPLSSRNKNYRGTMFGGSMFGATDPIYMIQLITILGDEYVVWDKAASIKFKCPGNQTLYAEFNLSDEFIESVKTDMKVYKEKMYKLSVNLKDKTGIVYAEIERNIYVASKKYHQNKIKRIIKQTN
ncbi:DUF4442 domain-containing protein [Aestuariivivens sediminis]|uniref:DUF4442 domain-containing protein n=1 Tax=Aestuariivivens sediminis TaxID=2913557 RepID=UPI001F5AC501|nr:DUF4442 domain-containing protein [Aestuariivivens sediminis]